MKIWLPTIRAGSGADVFTARLAAGLISRGIEAEVTWFPKYFEFYPQALRRVALPPGVTHVHANSWSAFAFHSSNVPLVVTVHHWVHDPAYRAYRSIAQGIYHRLRIARFERASLAAAAAVTTVSEYTAHCLAGEGVGHKLTVIHNGIDCAFFEPPSERVRNERFTLLFVGNHSRRKGFDLLEPIMEELGDGYELWCTGGLRGSSGPASSNIRFLGRLDDHQLVRAYQRADALLFPSRFEGFGLSPCEAMSCGLPVITSRSSALPELVLDQEAGFLNPVDDVGAFCHAVRRLANDARLAERMGMAGRRRVLEEFDQERMIGRYIELYRQLG